MHVAERAVHDWTATVSVTLQKESGRTAAAGGPLKEIDFWRARHMVRDVAAVREQLWCLCCTPFQPEATSCCRTAHALATRCSPTHVQVLGGLHEQMALPAVQRVAAFVESASTDAALVSAFRVQAGELAKLAAEARDNLKFLATLERHFQVQQTAWRSSHVTHGPAGSVQSSSYIS